MIFKKISTMYNMKSTKPLALRILGERFVVKTSALPVTAVC